MTALNNHDQSFSCLMNMAKRELGALMRTITDSYDAKQAKISAEDWIDEFELLNVLTELTTHELRWITITAIVRLANRLSEVAVQPDALNLVDSEKIVACKMRCEPPRD